MKTLIVILLLVLLAGSLSARALDEWALDEWVTKLTSNEERIAFARGFILGTYAAAVLANRMYGLSQEDSLKVMLLEVTTEELVEGIENWYWSDPFNRMDIPIYVAAYRRNIDE